MDDFAGSWLRVSTMFTFGINRAHDWRGGFAPSIPLTRTCLCVVCWQFIVELLRNLTSVRPNDSKCGWKALRRRL